MFMPVSTVFAEKGSYCRKGRFLPNLPKMTGFADLYFNAFSCFMVGDDWGLTGRGVGASVPYRCADCKFRYCYPPERTGSSASITGDWGVRFPGVAADWGVGRAKAQRLGNRTH